MFLQKIYCVGSQVATARGLWTGWCPARGDRSQSAASGQWPGQGAPITIRVMQRVYTRCAPLSTPTTTTPSKLPFSIQFNVKIHIIFE